MGRSGWYGEAESGQGHRQGQKGRVRKAGSERQSGILVPGLSGMFYGSFRGNLVPGLSGVI